MSSPAPDDTPASILQAACQHDYAATNQLIAWLLPFVQRWCQRAGLAANDGDDVSQQAILNIFRNLHRFRPEIPNATFRGWAYRVTYRCCLNHWQQRGPHTVPFGLAEEPAAPASDESQEFEQSAMALFMRTLVAEHANNIGFRAFYRTIVDGLAAPVVAVELNLTAASVRQHRHRWLQRLRTEFRQRFGEVLGEN